MIVPCMVNSWLYCSGLRNCCPGRASSVRISMAIAPPAMKKASDVTVYIMPICLGSVVQNSFSRDEPLTVSRAGYGRVAIGFGATAVTPASCALQPWLVRDGIRHGGGGRVWAGASRVTPYAGSRQVTDPEKIHG